jgi:hypothetical protein
VKKKNPLIPILLLAVMVLPSTAHPQQPAGGAVGNPAWGFTFTPPPGWKHQMDASGAVLGHDSIPGLILVIPHMQATMDGVISDMQTGLHDEGVSLSLSGEVKSLGPALSGAEYAGLFSGEQAKGYGLGTLSPHGGGAYIIAVTTPSKFSEVHRQAAAAIARSMTYPKTDTAGIMKHFAGYWWYYSGTSSISHERLIHLGPDGTFRQRGEDAADVSNYDQYGGVTSQYLGNQQSRGQGRWTVRGDKYKGIIVVTRPDGSAYNIQYQVKPKANQRFGDYYFNGDEYHWVTEEDLKSMGY